MEIIRQILHKKDYEQSPDGLTIIAKKIQVVLSLNLQLYNLTAALILILYVEMETLFLSFNLRKQTGTEL